MATVFPVRDGPVKVVGLLVHLVTGDLNNGIPAEVCLSTSNPVLLGQFALQLDIGLLLSSIIQSNDTGVLVEGRTHIVAGMAIAPMTKAEILTRFHCGHRNAGRVDVCLRWAASKAVRIQRIIVDIPEIGLGFLNPVSVADLVTWIAVACLLTIRMLGQNPHICR